MFKIALHLRPTQTKETDQAPEGCDQNSPIAQVLDSACDMLSDSGGTQFEMQIGSSAWPVDVRTDLSVFLEQLVPLLHFLDSGDGIFKISMYEQGIEANIVINTSQGLANVHCEPLMPGAKIRFDTSTESVTRSALIRNATQVRDVFLEGCRRICPKLISLPSFIEWSAATSIEATPSDTQGRS